jgi:hypothetical protein
MCSDDDVTSDRMCIYRPIRNKVGNFSIGGNILYPVNKAKVCVVLIILQDLIIFIKLFFQLSLKTFLKSSSNSYNPLEIDVAIDFCQFTSSPVTIEAGKYIVSSFWPEFLEKLGHLLHPCPNEVKFYHSPLHNE